MGEAIGNGFDSITGFFGDLLSYLNPMSESFILKIAFVPSDGYFSDYVDSFGDMINNKFAVIGQLKDTLTAFGTAVSSNANSDFAITADLSRYGIGEQEIVSGVALRAYGEKMKFWIGGLLYFITAMWLFRRVTSLLGEGR